MLGYDVDDDIAVVDPDGRQVELWFQKTDSTDADRQRFHATSRAARAGAGPHRRRAGRGRHLRQRREAPAFTVLADPEGNKVCVCTWQGREPD